MIGFDGQGSVMGSCRVELFEAIRRDARREELSVRALAERHRVHRRTVRAALESAVPPPRQPRVSPAPVLGPVKALIDQMLVADLTAPLKQRHTARRVLARLVDEHGATNLTYSSVRGYVARRRPQLAAEAGVAGEQAFVLQTHQPGAEAEVDFGDVHVLLAGELTKCFLFTLRLSHSGRAFHAVFASQGQEAFLEGHAAAFAWLGGVPHDKVRYDNLRSAVSRVLFGRRRQESERWVAFRSHYGFDAFYCRPGIVGAHEKGGVEGEVGRFRRNHLTPVPVVASLAELNARLHLADTADDGRRIEERVRTVGQDFAVEAPLLRPLPRDEFDAGLWLTPRVDRYGRVTVRQCHYSVPASLIGRSVRVSLRASELLIYNGRTEVARHARLTRKSAQSLVLDHYLEVLARKPGALPGATALVQARQSGVFTAEHEAFWAAARAAHGDAGGTRALIEVLLLHRHLPHAELVAALRLVVAVGGSTADAVAVEARKLARLNPSSNPDSSQGQPLAPVARRVVSLTERRLADPAAVIAGLPPDARPLPTVDAYDELLHRRASPAAAAAVPAHRGAVS